MFWVVALWAGKSLGSQIMKMIERGTILSFFAEAKRRLCIYRFQSAWDMYKIYPPSNFSYEMGRTWATVQIAGQDFFVQTGGVGPPFLYLHSFCSWFRTNKVTDHEATECHLTNCTGSTLDPTKFNHWQLQNVLRIYVGRNFGWHRPNYKMSLGKFMLAIPIFSYFKLQMHWIL